jgi:hypothetical protein
MQKSGLFTGAVLPAGTMCFWSSWLLMPGVGVTDAARILKLVSAHAQNVLGSSVLQLISSALFALAVLGLSQRFTERMNSWMRGGAFLLAVGACGDAADAVYHQLAYEMVRPGIDKSAVLPLMERMQSVDLRFVLPMILSFLVGCFALAVGSAKEKIVPKANPLLYALAIAAVLAGESVGVSGRVVGLVFLGLLSASVAWIGISIWRVQ